jgi:hypothetical protein
VAWWIITSVLVLGEVQEKSLSLSLLEETNLVRMNKSLLPLWWAVLRRLCCSFSLGQFPPSLLVNMLSISPVLPTFQDDLQGE